MSQSSDRGPAEFVGGTVSYAAKLYGVTLTETQFPVDNGPATGVTVSCDGTNAVVTVSLGPVESEAEAIEASDDASSKVWAALLLAVSDALGDIHMSPPGQRRVALKRAPRPGVIEVSGAGLIMTMGSVSITMTPGPAALDDIRRLATTPSWNPTAAPAYRLFDSAMREETPALQFLGLYHAMMVAFALPAPKPGRDEPSQPALDEALTRFDPSIQFLPATEREPKETPFTRARNRLHHPIDRRISLADAAQYARGQLQHLRKVVAALLRRGIT